MTTTTQSETLDTLTARHHTARTFAELLDFGAADYVPSFPPASSRPCRANEERATLTAAYNAAMAARGSSKRAWTGSR